MDKINHWVRYGLIAACDRRGMYKTGDAIWQVWRVVRKPLFVAFS
jgi:hypothetical protein